MDKKNNIVKPHFVGILIFAMIMDGVDFVGGAIPIFGDVLDIISAITLAVFGGGWFSAINLIEIIPGADFLPLHLISVIAALIAGKFNDKPQYPKY